VTVEGSSGMDAGRGQEPGHELRNDVQTLERFRLRAREFIAAHAPESRAKGGNRAPEPHEVGPLREWTAAMFAGGFLGGDWPEEYGGRADYDPREEQVFNEELTRASAPGAIGAAYLASEALITFGTPQQQRLYLPKIRAGEHIWCQLFSEPDAGSDLAGLRTRATRSGGFYTVNGQKVWTTNGHIADMGYLLARTDPEAEKHAGITAFLVDMKAPGIDVRPLREITGTADFNEIFFDNVQVPAENVIGAEGAGWKVATTSLVKERGANRGLASRLRTRFGDLLALWREAEDAGRHPTVSRQELGRLYAEVQVCAALQKLNGAKRLANGLAVADAPTSKIFSSEVNLRMVRMALELEGTRGVFVAGDSAVVDDGSWQDDFLYSQTYTIAGGSNEILRNMISERGLGLPR
jgi:alkylation response protein AidB-like acyl-CoA dehydrogenase